MRFWLTYVLLFINTAFVFSQSFIDKAQEKIDLLDSIKNERIVIATPALTEIATNTFIHKIDTIQLLIQDSLLDKKSKYTLEIAIYNDLYWIEPKNLIKIRDYQEKYELLKKWLVAENELEKNYLLSSNINTAFHVIPFIKDAPSVKLFLEKAASTHPDLVISNYHEFMGTTYGPIVAMVATINHPVSAKKYFTSRYALFNLLQRSQNDTIKTILQIHQQQPRNTKAYYLLNEIMSGNQSISSPDLLYQTDKHGYLRALINAVSKPYHLSHFSLSQELNYQALKYVRPINDLHDVTNPNIRFASLKDLDAIELYMLMIYSEEEIFTSSFNGFFDKLEKEMKNEGISGYQLFEKTGFHQFRKFIKMCAGYSKLNPFLATMNDDEKFSTFNKFVKEISASPNPLEEAVTIAESLASIDDPLLLTNIGDDLFSAYAQSGGTEVNAMYGLLITLLNQKGITQNMFLDSVAKLYPIKPIDELPVQALLGEDSVNTQIHFFYDDDDGIASFNSFVNYFKKANWSYKEQQEYIVLSSTAGNEVNIYANIPEHQKTAYRAISDALQTKDAAIDVIVHRGHSYHVTETINKIKGSTKLVLLGSCGGYHKLSDVLHLSPKVQIIATKQIGSQFVNNPMLYTVAEQIRQNKDIVWYPFWKDFEKMFDNNSYAKEKFIEYIGPHQNLGVLFIQAYHTYQINQL